MDSDHCTSWSFNKNETKVTGEEDEAQTVSTSYSKALNPAHYQPEADVEGCYDQFNGAVLSENITKTVTDAEGNILSQTSTAIRGGNRIETATTYESDDFGKTIKESTVTRKQQDGKWFPTYKTQVLSAYDDNGNVSQTETKSRKEGETEWQTLTVKTDYDEQGQVTGEYTPRGTKENVASKYEYNILGQMIQSEIPQEKRDGNISYQTTTTDKGENTEKQYYVTDPHGNVVQLTDESGAVIKTYEYDSFGNEVKPDGKDDNPFR